MTLSRRLGLLTAAGAAVALGLGVAPAHAETVLLQESFTTAGPTSGLYNKNLSDNAVSQWFFGRPTASNATGGSGAYAVFDSEFLHVNHPGNGFSAALVTPRLAKPVGSAVTVSFKTRLDLTTGVGRDQSWVQFSVDGRKTWHTAWYKNLTEVSTSTVNLTLPAAATDANHVVLRWRSKSYNAGNWQVDDIVIKHA